MIREESLKMKPTKEILDRISENSRNHKDEIFTKFYRYLLRPDLYYIAYQNLYSNKGAGTKGVDNDTADGFSEEKINKIIKSLSDETYQPKPVKREYIQKKHNSKKKRPLGIPVFTDKLVQEVLRIILEAVYEPTFSNYSHGFRPERSCHTVLKSLKKEFTGTTWFIEGDIKGCFDNIDHHVLVDIISRKIKDARLIQLIWKFLKAGYMENWEYHSTYSGCPQGGIISPILANIYLNELDKYAEKLAEDFFKPRKERLTDEYKKIKYAYEKSKKNIMKYSGSEKVEALKSIKEFGKQMRKTPCTARTDKVLKYIRYADDFIIGVKGDKKDCERIKKQLSEFINQTLKMELSEEKTLIKHSNSYARFLGYDIRVVRDNRTKPQGNYKKRTRNYMVELCVPLNDKIIPFLFDKDAIEQKRNGEIRTTARKSLYRCTDFEIVSTFNSELRGICNYYALASNYCRLNYFAYLMQYSCLKTLAGKHRTTTHKIVDMFRQGKNGWAIPYQTKQGKKLLYFADYTKCKNNKSYNDKIVNAGYINSYSRTTLEDRLSAKVCELCGKSDIPLEIHHVNKVKNLKGKHLWEIVMISKKRKTLAVCKDCHHKIHHS